METRVWIGTKGRYNPLQSYDRGTLDLDGDLLKLRGSDAEIAFRLSEVELSFPLSMSGTGFVVSAAGKKTYIWFYDPFSGRETLLKGGDQNEATLVGAKGWFDGRRAAKPWLKTLRAATR